MVQILDAGSKPTIWIPRRELVVPSYEHLWGGLEAAIPLWEGGGVEPIELISGARSGQTTLGDWVMGSKGIGIDVINYDDTPFWDPPGGATDYRWVLDGDIDFTCFVAGDFDTGGDPSYRGYICCRSGPGGGSTGGAWSLYYDVASTRFEFMCWEPDTTAIYYYFSTSVADLSGFHTIACTRRKGGNCKLYIDGKEVSQDTNTTTPASAGTASCLALGIPLADYNEYEKPGTYLCAYLWPRRALNAHDHALLYQDIAGIVRPKSRIAVKQLVTLTLEGHQFRLDDGDEINATDVGSQDSHITAPGGANRRLRILTDITGDPASFGRKLWVRRTSPSTTPWRVVELE